MGNLRSPCCRRDWNKHSVGFSPVSGMGVTGGPDPLAVRLQAASALRAQGGGWEGLRPVLGLTAPAPTEVLCLGPPTLASPGLGAEASSVASEAGPSPAGEAGAGREPLWPEALLRTVASGPSSELQPGGAVVSGTPEAAPAGRVPRGGASPGVPPGRGSPRGQAG